MSRRVSIAFTSMAMLVLGCDTPSDTGTDAETDAETRDASFDGSLIDARESDGDLQDGRTDAGGDELRDGPACSRSGWCWETPLPAGGPIWAIAATTPGEVIAKSGGFLFHADLDEIRWTSPPPSVLVPHAGGDVWAASSTDAWAHVFRDLLHFDGVGWTVEHTINPGAVLTGFASNDVWAVELGGVHHFDGLSWSELERDELAAVNPTAAWATGPEQFVFGGNAIADRAPFLWLLDAGELTDLELPVATGTVADVYASDADDVWVVVGADLHHLSDGTWSTLPTGPVFMDLWGAGSSDVWIAYGFQVDHIQGDERESFVFEGASQPLAIAGTSSTDVWVADVRGQLRHYDGSAWSVLHGEGLVDGDFQSISIEDGFGWAAGWSSITRETILARREPDGTWLRDTTPTPAGVPLGIVGVRHAGDEAFLFVYDGSFRWSGTTWERIVGDDGGLVDACMTSDGVIRATGERMATWDGEAWVDDADPLDESQLRIFCLESEAWTQPRRGAPRHFDGSGWFSEEELDDVIGVGRVAGGVLVLDSSGVSWLREGGTWRNVAEGPFPSLPAGGKRAHVNAEDDVWLLWDTGLLHFDGTSWSESVDPIGTFFLTLESDSNGTLYASGFHAAVASLVP